MSKKELKIKMNGEIGTIIAHLESIVKSLREGTLVIQKNDAFITLRPKETLMMKIEAEHKKEKEELSIGLSWRIDEVLTADSGAPLVITSREPETPALNGGFEREE